MEINTINVKNPHIIPGVNLASRAMAAKFFGVDYSTINNIVNRHSGKLKELGMREYSASELIEMGFEKVGFSSFKMGSVKIQFKNGANGVQLLNEECLKFIAGKMTNREAAKDVMEAVSKAAEPQEDAATDEEVEINDERFQVFSNPEFGDIRTIVMDGEPWFIGKDVTSILGYKNGSRDINRHVDDEDIRNYRNGTSEINNRGMNIINESGLYSLILSSKLPEAKKFKRWVTSEVLPSIRKHGAYMTTETLMEAMKNPDYVIQLVKELSDEQQKRIELEKKNSVLSEANSILAQDNLTWGDREILNSIVRKVACWFYPGNSLDKAVKFMWNSLYKDVMYKHHFNLRGKLDKASPEQLAKAVSVLVAKCMDVEIDLADIIGYANAVRVVNRYREEATEA